MGLNLVTLDEFKTYRGITKNEEKEDTKITQLIGVASALVKTYCNRTFIDFYRTNKIEYFDGTAYSEIFLAEVPIVQVLDVIYSSDGITYIPLTENVDYFVDNSNDIIYAKNGIPFVASSSFPARSLQVLYKGGYSDTPEDVKQAVLDIVEYYRSEQFTPRKMTSNMTLENVGFRAGNSIGLPPHIKRILEMYRIQ